MKEQQDTSSHRWWRASSTATTRVLSIVISSLKTLCSTNITMWRLLILDLPLQQVEEMELDSSKLNWEQSLTWPQRFIKAWSMMVKQSMCSLLPLSSSSYALRDHHSPLDIQMMCTINSSHQAENRLICFGRPMLKLKKTTKISTQRSSRICSRKWCIVIQASVSQSTRSSITHGCKEMLPLMMKSNKTSLSANKSLMKMLTMSAKKRERIARITSTLLEELLELLKKLMVMKTLQISGLN